MLIADTRLDGTYTCAIKTTGNSSCLNMTIYNSFYVYTNIGMNSDIG